MVTDYRTFNKRGGCAYQHKIRVIVGTKEKPVAHGITLPTKIAKKFAGCLMTISQSGTSIIMESGCKVSFIKQQAELQKIKSEKEYWRK